MADQQSENERLKDELRRERETSIRLRSDQINSNDRLMAVAAALGLRVDNNIPNLEVLVQAISTLKSRQFTYANSADEAQAEVKRLTAELEAERAKSKPEADLP